MLIFGSKLIQKVEITPSGILHACEWRLYFTITKEGRHISEYVALYQRNVPANNLEQRSGGSSDKWEPGFPGACAGCGAGSLVPLPLPLPSASREPSAPWHLRWLDSWGRRELSGAVTGSRLIIRFISLRLPGHNPGRRENANTACWGSGGCLRIFIF